MLFYKMNGLGNDYIFIDTEKVNKRELDFLYDNLNSVIVRLSDRHFGIGGDGVVIIDSSDTADAKMRIFNADGSEGKTCGNALRCVGKLLSDKSSGRLKEMAIETLSGIKSLMIIENSKVNATVKVNMGFCNCYRSEKDFDYVDVGNPHAVLYCEVLDDNAIIEAKKISDRYDVNAEIVKVLNHDQIEMRVWERGSGETLACGSGACAVTYSAHKRGLIKNKIEVMLKGGILHTELIDNSIYMTGPTALNFIGEINIYNYG